MLKKLFCIFLVCVLALSAAGCSKNTTSKPSDKSDAADATDEAGASELEPMTLTIVFPYINKAPEDIKMVEEALSKIAQSKINASIKLMPIAYASWNEQFNLMMSSGTEKVDLLATGLTNSTLSSMVNKGYLLEMDDLLNEYRTGVKEVVGDYIIGGKVNGKTYSVPTMRDLATSTGLMIMKSFVDKYNIDTDAIKSWEELTPVLAAIKEGEGKDFKPMFLNASQYTNFTSVMGDQLGDALGTLAPDSSSADVVNRFELEEYRNLVKLINEWYTAGYINIDAATTTTTWQDAAKAGTSACWPNNMKPGQVTNQTNMLGQEIIGIHIGEDVVTTSSLQAAMWSIPFQAENPERSMMLLELLYTDSDFFNILCWGIEGTHYVKTEDGHITYPEGITADTTGWGINMGWIFGDQFLSYLWEGSDLDLWTKTKEFNDSAKLSPAAGFVFDTTNVKNEYAACMSVKSEYIRPIETGSVDLSKLDEMNEKLYSSGLQKIIDEKQKQIDAFLQK